MPLGSRPTVAVADLSRRKCVVRFRVEASVPPRVDYALTAFGRSLAGALTPLGAWGDRSSTRIEDAVERRLASTLIPEAGRGVVRCSVLPAFPTAICRTNELEEAGSFWTADVAGTAVLVTRDIHGTIRAFVNHCRHREVRLVHEKRGVTKMFTCIMHGWTYDAEGQMGGMVVAHLMRDNPLLKMIRDNSALTPLPSSLHRGFVWVATQADAALDVASFLGPVDTELAARGVESFVVRERTEEAIGGDIVTAVRPCMVSGDALHVLSDDLAVVLHAKDVSVYTVARKRAESDFGEPSDDVDERRTLEHVLLTPA